MRRNVRFVTLPTQCFPLKGLTLPVPVSGAGAPHSLASLSRGLMLSTEAALWEPRRPETMPRSVLSSRPMLCHRVVTSESQERPLGTSRHPNGFTQWPTPWLPLPRSNP